VSGGAQRILVCSNMLQHMQTAAALRAGGHRVSFLGPLLYRWDAERWPVGEATRRLLQRRRILGLRPGEVRSLWCTELAQRALTRAGAPAFGNKVLAEGFDRAALAHLDGMAVFHFHSGLCVKALARARAAGTLLVCDERGPHVLAHQRIIDDEQRRLGLPVSQRGDSYFRERTLAGYQAADVIFVASTFARQTFLDEGFSPEKIFVAPYGLTWPERRRVRSQHAPAGVFRILYVGRVTPAKGIAYLLEAFAALGDPTAELTLVGQVDQTMGPLLARAGDRVKVVGPVPKEELPAWYRGASVLVLPTLVDSFGFVVAEAVAEDLPVLVTNSAGIAEHLEDRVSAFIVPPRDAVSLRVGLEELRADPAVRARLAAAAHGALRACDWARYGDQVRAAYRAFLPA
jgi:starch synthase